MKHILFILSIFVLSIIFGCNNKQNDSTNKIGKIILPKTLKEAVIYTVVPTEAGYNRYSGVPNAEYYYYYKNKDEIKRTITIADSIRIEKLTAVFYTFKIKDKEFYKTDWFLNIDGYFLPIFIYITQYDDNEEFSSENQELVKAIEKKIEAWRNKSIKKWW